MIVPFMYFCVLFGQKIKSNRTILSKQNLAIKILLCRLVSC